MKLKNCMRDRLHTYGMLGKINMLATIFVVLSALTKNLGVGRLGLGDHGCRKRRRCN